MATKTTVTTSRLKVDYNTRVAKELAKELGLKNFHQVPKLHKIAINVGLGRAQGDKKMMEVATNTIRKITGQQPVQTTAKQSIAGFKLREGTKIGLKVTLRDERMYEFLDRLITIVVVHRFTVAADGGGRSAGGGSMSACLDCRGLLLAYGFFFSQLLLQVFNFLLHLVQPLL